MTYTQQILVIFIHDSIQVHPQTAQKLSRAAKVFSKLSVEQISFQVPRTHIQHSIEVPLVQHLDFLAQILNLLFLITVNVPSIQSNNSFKVIILVHLSQSRTNGCKSRDYYSFHHIILQQVQVVLCESKRESRNQRVLYKVFI